MCNGVPVRTFISFPDPQIPSRSAGFRGSPFLEGRKNVQPPSPHAQGAQMVCGVPGLAAQLKWLIAFEGVGGV